jgi:hypothetical protein
MPGLPTASQLREILSYDRESGDLVRIKSDKRFVNKKAGFEAEGYWKLKVFNKTMYSHRVIWCMVTGDWPKHEIDHVDGNKLNNRMNNLRDAPHAINTQNFRKCRKDNLLKKLGVSKDGDSYRTEIQVNGERFYIGSFPTALDAVEAYLTVKRVVHAGCAI